MKTVLRFWAIYLKDHRAISEKIQTGGVEDIIFGKRLLEFSNLSLYPWKFQTN